jgi:hypothetical protein
MLRSRRQTVRVPFRNNPAAMEDEEAIGVAWAQRARNRGLFAALAVEGDILQVAPCERQTVGAPERAMFAVGINSRTLRKPHLLNGCWRQFARLTSLSSAGEFTMVVMTPVASLASELIALIFPRPDASAIHRMVDG